MSGFLLFLGIALLLVLLASRLFLPPKLNFLKPVAGIAGIGLVLWGVMTGAFFYAEPGFKYHVRTFFGDEKMVRDVGWNTHLWGRVNARKNAMSVQSSSGGLGDLSAEFDGASMSANLGPQTLVFLDQVDAEVTATARFQLPEDEESFLRLARQFRHDRIRIGAAAHRARFKVGKVDPFACFLLGQSAEQHPTHGGTMRRQARPRHQPDGHDPGGRRTGVAYSTHI